MSASMIDAGKSKRMAFNEECLRRPTMAAWMRVSKVSLSTKVSLLSIDSFDKKVSHHMSRVR